MKLFIITICSLIMACSNGVSPESRKTHDDQVVQIFFHYYFRNELDTYRGTYQKDLVIDGTATTTMWLTSNEQEIILTALDNYRFFSLPDTIYRRSNVIQSPEEGPQVLRIKYRGQEKSIVWYDTSDPNDRSMYFVNALRDLLINIIVAKPEYKALPPANGLYVRTDLKAVPGYMRPFAFGKLTMLS